MPYEKDCLLCNVKIKTKTNPKPPRIPNLTNQLVKNSQTKKLTNSQTKKLTKKRPPTKQKITNRKTHKIPRLRPQKSKKHLPRAR